jgi:hypothetical protein
MQACKTVAQNTYIHIEALAEFTPTQRELVAQAAMLAKAEAGWEFNVVKLG